MKRASSIFMIIILVLSNICLSSCKSYNGFYYNLDDARSEKNFYTNADYVFTKELENFIIDFIIKEHVLHIVEIKTDTKKSKQMFKVKHSASFSIEESIYMFEQSNIYDWNTSSGLSLNQFTWCIVSEEFNSKHNNYPSFKFYYKDIHYDLCYNIKKTEKKAEDGSIVS